MFICEVSRVHEDLVKRLGEKAGAFDYDGRPDIACDYEQAADAIVEVSDKLAIAEEDKIKLFCQIPRWIPMTERLPDAIEDVLIYVEWTGVSGAKYREIWLTDLESVLYQGDKPIAWMPLPEPPKEE